MKVQKITRKQGEYAKVNQDIKDKDLLKIVDAGEVVTGDFGDRNVFKVETRNGEKNLSFNQTSMNNLIEAFGDETNNWVGHQVKVWLITQSVSGQIKKVCYLTDVNWDMVEDDKGNLKFAPDQRMPQGDEDDVNGEFQANSVKEKDLPF